jgi:hypothetical protein
MCKSSAHAQRSEVAQPFQVVRPAFVLHPALNAHPPDPPPPPSLVDDGTMRITLIDRKGGLESHIEVQRGDSVLATVANVLGMGKRVLRFVGVPTIVAWYDGEEITDSIVTFDGMEDGARLTVSTRAEPEDGWAPEDIAADIVACNPGTHGLTVEKLLGDRLMRNDGYNFGERSGTADDGVKSWRLSDLDLVALPDKICSLRVNRYLSLSCNRLTALHCKADRTGFPLGT